MRIKLSPQRRDDRYDLAVAGDVLIVNGESFDFGMLGEGEFLPVEAISSPWFTGSGVRRAGGEVVVELILPHGERPPPETCFPDDIVDPADGPVDLPPFNRYGEA